MPDTGLIKMTPKELSAVRAEIEFMVKTHVEEEGKWADRNKDELTSDLRINMTGTKEPGHMTPERAPKIRRITEARTSHKHRTHNSPMHDDLSHQDRGR